MARIGIALATAALAIIGLTGCTTTIAGTATPYGADAGQADTGSAETGSADAGGDPGPPDVDVCSLLPDATVTRLIGANDGGAIAEFSLDPRSSTCTWNSTGRPGVLVLLEIGRHGTAPGGALRPIAPGNEDFYAPLPDGMRRFGVDKVEFAAGDRFCGVRVATGPRGIEGDEDATAAAGLVEDIRAQL